MESKEVLFEREKVAVMHKIERELLNDLSLQVSPFGDDFIKNTLTIKLSAFIYSNLAEERNLDYYFDRPSFLDWLLRKKRKATFKLKVKDLLLNAPKPENTMRTYNIEP